MSSQEKLCLGRSFHVNNFLLGNLLLFGFYFFLSIYKNSKISKSSYNARGEDRKVKIVPVPQVIGLLTSAAFCSFTCLSQKVISPSLPFWLLPSIYIMSNYASGNHYQDQVKVTGLTGKQHPFSY